MAVDSNSAGVRSLRRCRFGYHHAMRRCVLLSLVAACASNNASRLEIPDGEATDAAESTPDTRPSPDGTSARDSGVAGTDRPADRSADQSAASDVTRPTSDAPPGPSAGCGAGAGLPEGMATIDAGGQARLYVLRLPAGYTNQRPWPLVFALHPNGSNSGYWDSLTGTRAIRRAAAGKAIIVMGQARSGDWRDDPIPMDLAYFEAMMQRLQANLCVDTKRMFSMGFSGGGSFSGVLGCYRRDIRAIATGGAVTYFDPRQCVGNPAAWITIGDGEAVAGRLSFRDFWRTRNGCATTSTAVPPPPCIAYTCPNPAQPTTFCSHPGGHEWPSFGTDAVWDFFAQF